MAGNERNIILDSTLNGMGKCAGNLNTELIVDYLTRKKNYDYELDIILDIIDRYLAPLKKELFWGYSIPAFMAGVYKSHPNNIIYLTDKYRLDSKDIKYIISAIDEEKRQRYDYENIQKIYRQYNANLYDDKKTLNNLRKKFKGQDILIIAPGSSINKYREEIKNYIRTQSMVVISVNFIPINIRCDYYFYANAVHWGRVYKQIEKDKCILASNIHEHTDGANIVDYSSILEEKSPFGDNSTIMLLNLLKKLEVRQIRIVGFDGLSDNGINYVNSDFVDNNKLSTNEINEEIRNLYHNFKERTCDKMNVKIITPTLYE